MQDSLLLSRLTSGQPEIFTSIQGEGVSLGTASTFIRLATCNLRCSWCDTSYTWDWARFDREARATLMPVADVADQVQRNGVRNVVITGGEPLLQMAPLIGLAKRLARCDHTIEVETNGTIVPDQELLESITQWNVSPKLKNSGESVQRRERPAALQEFTKSPRAFFKFVVCHEREIDDVADVVARYAIAPERVFLMPEGTTEDVLTARIKALIPRAAAHGFRISPRLHITIWGNQPGT